MFKKILGFLKKFQWKSEAPEPEPKVLTFKPWTQIMYEAAVYEIAPTDDGQWAACICLFMNKPDHTSNPLENDALMFQMNIIFPTPEEVVTYLHMMGPLFLGISANAIQIDKTGEIVKIWSVAQPNIQPTVLNNNIVMPTHAGTNTVN
jgi:hypothetical protein